MDALQRSLLALSDKLATLTKRSDRNEIRRSIEELTDAANDAAKAFSGSWIGYHSCVYYADLKAPPPGAHFSPEWGMKQWGFADGTRGDWREYSYEAIYNALKAVATGMDLVAMGELGAEIVHEADDYREELLSILTAVLAAGNDSYIGQLLERTKNMRLQSVSDIAGTMHPRGQVMVRDSLAVSQGMRVPPHIALFAQVRSLEAFFRFPDTLSDVARHAAAHIGRRIMAKRELAGKGTKVFVGHGASSAWCLLKDFLQDRLGLEWDEFNRVSIAGVSNVARLSEMLDNARIAFLVMTAEDERKDGKIQARMNVVHEAGLFQGRLGFEKAIIVLEHGCEEFSNIQGLGQIRFAAGKIEEAFEEIRRVLEREGVIKS